MKIAKPNDLATCQIKTNRLGVRLRWRRLELGKHGGDWKWRDE